MKIRTDFVTNSSSYSTAEVVIDNPVLLEILQKYKDEGTFNPDHSDINIGCYESYEGCILPSYEEFSKTPALHVWREDDGWGNSWGNVPSSLEEVVECVLACIKDGEMVANPSLFDQMEAELVQRQQEILTSYKRVAWKYGDSVNEGVDEDHDIEISFVFDPIDGEKYNYIDGEDSESTNADSDETIEDDEVSEAEDSDD